jgi:predicted Zn finger-like uncharacterized protein
MNMVTRCPGCNTLFRVTTPQLQAREGKVRCGRCTLIFDGFKMLAAMPELPATGRLDVAQASEVDSNSSHPQPVAGDETIVAPVTVADAQIDTGLAADANSVPQAATARAVPDLPAGTADFVAVTASTSLPQAWEEAFLEEPVPVMSQRNRWLWGTASLLLLFAITAQAVYFYRTQLASNYPGLKPVLAQICDALGCSVPLPQGHELIKVEASDLQFVDPARPALIQLRVTLRNPAAFDLAFPNLDLVLTNTQDHTLARRIFLPSEYLGPGKEVKSGIPANAEVTLSLDMDTGDLGASGFRLYLLPGFAS